jgi:hypothetical protein
VLLPSMAARRSTFVLFAVVTCIISLHFLHCCCRLCGRSCLVLLPSTAASART